MAGPVPWRLGGQQPHRVGYCAGVLLLDRHEPRRVLYRSAHSVLEPRLAAEREGMVPWVVFPTGVDVQPDGALDVYYGMADSRIGVARTRCGMAPAPAPARAAHGQGRPTHPNGELRAGPGLAGKGVHVNSIALDMIATLMTARHRRST
jgi:beta-1,4-mannooligosaccharide phosphorylase